MSDMPERELSIVVPVYNSEGTLPPLAERLGKILPGIAKDYEVIFVNDGSRDNSWAVIRGLCEAHAWIHGIDLMRNYGQHNALLCGIRAARYDTIVTMDDDLQHPPEEIPRLLDALTPDTDVVYGTPAREQHGWWRDAASQVTKLALQNAMGVEVARVVSAFRAFRADLRNAFTHYRGPFVSIDALLTWGARRFKAVSTRHEQRAAGVSNYTFRKLIVHALNMMTAFSALPLQLANITGFVFMIFGLIVLFFVVGRYLVQGGSAPGFAFLASIIAIFSGVQLFTLGIIGEYMARIHFRSMEKPSYAIRSATDAP